MLRYERKIVNTEVDVDKTVGLLFRQKRGGDKMVSSFVQDTTEFTVFLSQRECTGLISQTPFRTKQGRVNSVISMAAW